MSGQIAEQMDTDMAFGGDGAARETVVDENNKIETGDDTRKVEGDTVGIPTVDNPVITVRNCDVFYADTHAIKNVSLDIGRNEVISLIGPFRLGYVILQSTKCVDKSWILHTIWLTCLT